MDLWEFLYLCFFFEKVIVVVVVVFFFLYLFGLKKYMMWIYTESMHMIIIKSIRQTSNKWGKKGSDTSI